MSLVWLWNDSFSTFDEALFHFHGTVLVVQFEVEAAGVADGVALCVAAPERSGGGVAVLTSY